MKLTKIDVAEARIRSAVRLYFDEAPIASVHLLAASAREILTTVGGKLGVRTVLHGFSDERGVPLKDAITTAQDGVNFLKHADRDPTATLVLDTEHTRDLLMIACHDFGRVTSGLPVEAQIYECWWFVTQIPNVQRQPRDRRRSLRNQIRFWPSGIRTASGEEQRAMGREMLAKYERDPKLAMEFTREVVLPSAPSR